MIKAHDKQRTGTRPAGWSAGEVAAGTMSVLLLPVSVGGCALFLAHGGRLWMLAAYLLLVAVWAALVWRVRSRLRLSRKDQLLDALNESRGHIQQMRLQKRQEQLNALQSQINPHFLYNTLDTIRGLAIEKDSPEIAGIVAALASMFKYSMDYASTTVTVSEELAHLEQYVSIQRMRFPGRFSYEKVLECDDEQLYRVTVPKMTLQPIVENAISHGLRSTSGGGRIALRLVQSDVDFKIIVSDNGRGIDDETVQALNRSFRQNRPDGEMGVAGSGIALANIDLRTKISFGDSFGLHIVSTPGLGTDVTVRLPAQEVPA